MKASVSVTLAYIGIVALVVCLTSTFIALWMGKDNSATWVTLTQQLLSWQVILGSLGVGAGITFKEAIRTRIHKP
jgi:hypothetical protein